MNDVSEIAVCPLSSDAELVSQAKMLWDGIIRSSRDMIRYKFAIGGLVRIALTRARHDDAAVTRLATELTNACGKLILPQRLYEAARLHEAFAGRLELVWEFERRLPRYTSQPLSYTYLIRQILPRVTKDRAWNHQEWEHYQEEQLGRLEQAVEQIEALSRPVPVPEEPYRIGADADRDTTTDRHAEVRAARDQEADLDLTRSRSWATSVTRTSRCSGRARWRGSRVWPSAAPTTAAARGRSATTRRASSRSSVSCSPIPPSTSATAAPSAPIPTGSTTV